MPFSLDTIIHYFPAAVQRLVHDPHVTDLMIMGDRIFVEERGQKRRVNASIDAFDLRTIINYIAVQCEDTINEQSPILDARLPDGSRVNAVIQPVAFGGDTLTIRKFGGWFSVDQLIACGTLPEVVVDYLRIAANEGGNIVLSGPTGSGKTTVLNAVISLIPADQRLIVIEKPAELQIQHECVVRWSPRKGQSDGSRAITWSDLIEAALRSNPDRIILGEIRDQAAYDLIQALNTGHGGSMSTTHANSCQDALERLSDMALSARTNLQQDFIRRSVARSIQYVVQVKKEQGQRQVTEMVKSVGYAQGSFQVERLYTKGAKTAYAYS